MCWATAGLPPQAGIRAATTRQRWQQVHDLLDKGVGLLECARRPNLGLNTIKRYARISEPQRLVRAPQYQPTLVDPYHLRRRRQQDPAIGATQLLAEIRELGYTGSLNLLYRYITQGRVEADRPALSPRRLTRYLLTRPDQLTDHQRTLVDALTRACSEMTALDGFINSFAALLTPASGNDDRLTAWTTKVKATDLPHLHTFTRGLGLDRDRDAVNAALTHPFHNGGTEGVNTKTKLIKRQMYGRAGFALLRHRILLN
ncbi:Transposase [Micromonospora matsumotoense]|uniref:Transposase n=1 Tax=Micromonospora matsumotoense TaxID=121616 RepID=A0A1C5AW97_9ACTN|nr:Transposase [Micromonospora matsumotoense]